MSDLFNTLAFVHLSNLSKRFGAIQAVDGVTLTVNQGEVLGFLGPNGAGKTTTMRLATGYLAPDAGRVNIKGIDLAVDPIAVKKLIGYLPEGSPGYGEMTVKAFLNFIADIRGIEKIKKQTAIDAVVAKAALSTVYDQVIDTLSKGFKRRVGIAQALIHDPPVLILDEPTDGLDPNQKFHMRTLIKEMAKDKAIIISTHILEEVDAICTRAVIINGGKLIADGTPSELRKGAKTLDETFRKLTAA